MKIGIRSGLYTKHYGFANGMKRIKELGYDCIDHQIFVHTEDPLFSMPWHEAESVLREQRRIIEDSGLEISQTHGPWRWPAMDDTPERRAERFEKMAFSIRGTAVLGCRRIVIHPIMPFDFWEDPHERETHDMNLEFFSRLVRIAEDSHVVICYENMPFTGLIPATPSECLAFARDINSPWFRICLDTGHCAVRGVNPSEAVRTLGKEWLAALHVHDNNGKSDLHWIPYTGVIDWKDFSNALAEIGFDGSVSLETDVPGGFPDDVRFLQEEALARAVMHIAGKAQKKR